MPSSTATLMNRYGIPHRVETAAKATQARALTAARMPERRVHPVPEGRVVVVGSVNADLVVAVDRLPGPGETVAGGRFARHGGGKGANQAVAAARLGARVTMIGAIGADELGDAAVRE